MVSSETEKQSASSGADIPAGTAKQAVLEGQEPAPADHEVDAVAQAEASAEPDGEQPPPDGGLLAWLQVLGSFFLFMNTWWARLLPQPFPLMLPCIHLMYMKRNLLEQKGYRK